MRGRGRRKRSRLLRKPSFGDMFFDVTGNPRKVPVAGIEEGACEAAHVFRVLCELLPSATRKAGASAVLTTSRKCCSSLAMAAML
jgi:hypothetical protein